MSNQKSNLFRNPGVNFTNVLRAQIPKVHKRLMTVFFSLSWSACVKAAHKRWWNWPKVSISSAFYVQHLHAQITKGQKNTDSKSFAPLGSAHACKSFELTCWWNQPQVSIWKKNLHAAFTQTDPKNVKRLTTWLNFSHFCNLGMQKLLIKCCWNWQLESISTTFNE